MLAFAALRALSIALLLGSSALFYFQCFGRDDTTRINNSTERYRPSLIRVDSIDRAIPVVSGYIAREVGNRDERIVRGIDAFVRDRFVHGFSYTSWQENWIIWLLGRLPVDWDTPVHPDSILLHGEAMCSQQAIVFQALLARFDIPYASVRMAWPDQRPNFRGHFAVAAQVDGEWRYFDPNLEAARSPLMTDVVAGKATETIYPHHPHVAGKVKIAAANGTIMVTDQNRHPGPRGQLLQQVTRVMSLLTPVAMAILSAILWVLSTRMRVRTMNRHDLDALPAVRSHPTNAGIG